MKHLFLSAFLLLLLFCCSSWGFYAHQRINKMAVFTLPPGISRFYKSNVQYLSDHAVDPDKRRYADTAESPRHFLDVERYETHIDSIPRNWEAALKKYGSKKLREDGTLPWHIQLSYHRLVKAFKDRDSARICYASAYLGHYLADAHVPLHTTENHNGQLTNQLGIHAFWESRVPELFAERYNFFVGKARYIPDPLVETWKILRNSHNMVDSVLRVDRELSDQFPGSSKYSFSKRNHVVVRQYSRAYTSAYQSRLNGMVSRQMRASILSIGCFWYSAWIDAGQPDLEGMPKN